MPGRLPFRSQAKLDHVATLLPGKEAGRAGDKIFMTSARSLLKTRLSDPSEALNKTAILSPEKKVGMGIRWCYIELWPPKKIHCRPNPHYLVILSQDFGNRIFADVNS